MKWELIILMIFLVACAKPAADITNKTYEPVVNAPEVKVQPEPVAKDMDITNAVQLGKPIKCVSEQAGQTVTLYMKNGQMRMDTLPVNAHGIYTADVMYTWQGKTGTIMKMEDVKAISAEAAEQYKPKTQTEVIENAQKVNAKCELAEVSDDVFVPPSDVQFQDVGAMIRQIEAMTKTLQK